MRLFGHHGHRDLVLRTLKPLLIPLVLNLVLATVRPWTVADFTSRWVRQTLDGEPAAVFSFLLVPIVSGFMAWVELRSAFEKARARRAEQLTFSNVKKGSPD